MFAGAKVNLSITLALCSHFGHLCRLAGVPEMGYHALRHAYNLADRNVPLHTIRDLLGHENISSTSRYLKSSGRGG